MNTHVATADTDHFGTASNGKIGMWIFLVTDGMSFAGLLLSYGILRAGGPNWPIPGQHLNLPLTALATFILICSSLTMVLALAAANEGNKRGLIQWLSLTILGGISFLGVQATEWTSLMSHAGMTFTSFAHGNDLFSSTFFVITGFHGMHVLTGVIYLTTILLRSLSGRYTTGNSSPVELCGLFWHFVDLVWILVFTFIYLL